MLDPHSSVKHYAHLLKKGGVVAFPTETVYGLGASVFDLKAIQRIFQVKGRPQDNPLIVHISSLDQLKLIVQPPPELFFRLADTFFPGPLTILLPKLEEVPDAVSAGLPLIGVRMPAHPLARQLIEEVAVPLVAPSANLSGKPSSTTAQHVWDDFGDRIDGILDGGPCSVGLESTVITLNPVPQILRPGAVTQEELERVLNRPVLLADGKCDKPLSPGMKYRHYAPKAKVWLFNHWEELQKHREASHKRTLILKEIHPEHLYASLRRADAENQEEILIFCSEEMLKNGALMNRLLRASQ